MPTEPELRSLRQLVTALASRYGITGDQPCNPDFKDDLDKSGPCHSGDETKNQTTSATGQPTMRRWGGVPYMGGQGIGNKGKGRMWGKTRSGVIVPKRYTEAA